MLFSSILMTSLGTLKRLEENFLEGYSYKEIGLLLGAAVGCIFAVIGFTKTGYVLNFMFTGLGIAIGVVIGSIIDRKKNKV